MAAEQARYVELRGMLEARRAELMIEVRGKMIQIRSGGPDGEVRDSMEEADAKVAEDIEIALIKMKADTLNQINDALRRLEDGEYGNCTTCGNEITVYRLRALVFASLCRDCEEAEEDTRNKEQAIAHRTRFLYRLGAGADST